MQNFRNFGWFLFFIGVPKITEACSVCFRGDPESPGMIGLKWAILILLGILTVILALLGRFFLNFRRRSRLLLVNSK